LVGNPDDKRKGGHMSVRKISNTGTRKVILKFASYKNKRTVWCESQLEGDYPYWLEFDRDVDGYEREPFRIYYFRDGKEHYYTPDFQVRRKNKTQIVEVKYEEEAETEECQRLFTIASDACDRMGYEFLVVTEKDIRIKPKLNNLKILYRYARVNFDSEMLYHVKDYFSVRDRLVLREAESHLAVYSITRPVLLSMVFHGFLYIDLMQPITKDSVLEIAK